MFEGALTAIITPFTGGKVDWNRLDANVRFQIEQGIDGLVPVGTTGESPTLSHEEHREVIERVVKAARRKVKVLAGAGSNSTAEALELTRHARQTGADGVLSVNPYYNKPTQEGLYRHFMAVADVGLPVVLYNIPGRTGVALTPQTVARLAAHPKIVGIKEATGSLDMASEIASLCDIVIVSGDDSLTLPLMSIGGRGVISVASNLLPAKVKALTSAGLSGDWAGALALHKELFGLFKALFIETNPIGIKTAMKLAGMDSGEMRLPMCEASPSTLTTLEQTLRRHKVIG